MRLQRSISNLNLPEDKILSAIKTELIRLKVNEIEVTGNLLIFKNGFFNGQGRNHLMAPVDKGYFRVDSDKQRLVYNYSTIRMMLITSVMSLFFGVISQKPIVIVVFFYWLYGMNWVIAMIRHRLFIKKLIKRIIPEHNTTLADNRAASPGLTA